MIQKNFLIKRLPLVSSKKSVDGVKPAKIREKSYFLKPVTDFYKKELVKINFQSISSFSWLKTLVMRLTTILLIVMINYLGLSGIGFTHAYFSDEEISEDNSFTDGILDFRMTYDCDSEEDVISDFTPTNPIVRNHTVYQEGTLNFQYQVQPINFSGNLDFCNQLMLTADLGGTQVFSGRLVDFNYTTIFSTSTYLWLYTLTLPEGLSDEYHHQTCEFTAVYEGWQENLPTPDQGFYDIEKKHYVITSGEWSQPSNNKIVVNEVYYDVDDQHGSERPSQTDEWVELYNNTDYDINLKDWTLTDNDTEVSISHRNVILPAHQFAVIAKAAQTWTYWNIPAGAVRIELGQPIGNGLDNDGDRVILKDNNGTIIDMMSYGNDTFAFDPSVPDVAEGHSVARHPAGFDTDQASDWEDLSEPNPGTNPHTVQPPLTFTEDLTNLINENNTLIEPANPPAETGLENSEPTTEPQVSENPDPLDNPGEIVQDLNQDPGQEIINEEEAVVPVEIGAGDENENNQQGDDQEKAKEETTQDSIVPVETPPSGE